MAMLVFKMLFATPVVIFAKNVVLVTATPSATLPFVALVPVK